MNRYALMENNIVKNIVDQESMPTLFGSWVDITGLSVGPGFRYDNGTWTPPSQQVPEAVTMRQARLALLNNNLLIQVQPAIDSLPEPDKSKAQIEWEYSSEVQRHNSFVSLISAALGLTNQQLDDLFIEAASL